MKTTAIQCPHCERMLSPDAVQQGFNVWCEHCSEWVEPLRSTVTNAPPASAPAKTKKRDASVPPVELDGVTVVFRYVGWVSFALGVAALLAAIAAQDLAPVYVSGALFADGWFWLTLAELRSCRRLLRIIAEDQRRRG